MPIPFKLDYVIERTLAAQQWSEGREIKSLTGLNVSEAEARAVWSRIVEHKWYMSERLGRDVGMRVAAIDFFENINAPRAVRPTRREFVARLRRAMGTQALAA